jgi:inorganic pyrophosphatase
LTKTQKCDIILNVNNFFMSNLYFLPSGNIDKFNVVVEIPKGSNNKYEYTTDGYLALDRVLPSSDFYPFNYGFVPSTKVSGNYTIDGVTYPGDGDALDVMLLLTNSVPPCTVVTARAIGMMVMIDSGELDNKILAVPTEDPRFDDILDINDLPKHIIVEIEDFFKTYKRLKNKTSEILAILGQKEATEEVKKYLNNYIK